MQDKPAGAACLKCPLRLAPCVPSEGPAKPRLVIVGESPNAEETSEGRPLVGRAGAYLGTALSKLGVKRSECYVTNAVLCHSTNKDHVREAAKHCKRRLHEELAASGARSIIALGSGALKPILRPRKAGIKDWRGSISCIRWERDGKGVLHAYDETQVAAKGALPPKSSYIFPIMHPGFIVHGAEEWGDIFKLDVERACRYLHKDWLSPEHEPGRILITCDKDIDALELLKEEVVAADVETNEAHSAVQARLSCAVFADRKISVVLPWTLDVAGFNPWWKNPSAIATKVMQFMGKKRLVAHNGAYDLPVFHSHGMPFSTDIEDTMLAQHAIDSHMPKNLRHVASLFNDVCQWKLATDHRGDIKKLHDYNHLDGIYSILTWHAIKEELNG